LPAWAWQEGASGKARGMGQTSPEYSPAHAAPHIWSSRVRTIPTVVNLLAMPLFFLGGDVTLQNVTSSGRFVNVYRINYS
jgi:hypothetical protein